MVNYLSSKQNLRVQVSLFANFIYLIYQQVISNEYLDTIENKDVSTCEKS